LLKNLDSNKVNVNCRDSNGRTPLHYAVVTKHLEIVSLLLERGADVNAQDNEGWTPCHRAAYWGYFNIVDLLLSYNADVLLKTYDKASCGAELIPVDLVQEDNILKNILEDATQKQLMINKRRRRKYLIITMCHRLWAYFKCHTEFYSIQSMSIPYILSFKRK